MESWQLAVLIALGPTLLTGMFGLVQYVAKRWQHTVEIERGYREGLEKENEELNNKVISKTDALTNAEVKLMFAKHQYEQKEKELEECSRERRELLEERRADSRDR